MIGIGVKTLERLELAVIIFKSYLTEVSKVMVGFYNKCKFIVGTMDMAD